MLFVPAPARSPKTISQPSVPQTNDEASDFLACCRVRIGWSVPRREAVAGKDDVLENLGDREMIFNTIEFLDSANEPLVVPDQVRLIAAAAA